MKNIMILGAGCWGGTLASIYANKGFNVTLWEPIKENLQYLHKFRHPKFFNYIKLQKNVHITDNLSEIENSHLILLVMPSIYVRDTLQKINDLKLDLNKKLIISCVKGLDQKTQKRITEIIEEILKINTKNLFVFSGPTHAEEVAMNKPTAITLAGNNEESLLELQKILSTPTLRVYTNNDVAGVEIAGAVKNVYAIAAGICDGLKLGNNAKAALITRSLKEMILLGKIFKAKVHTFFGLAGIGDLLTTAYSKFSRNRTFGEYIAKYKNIDKAKQKIKTSIEGFFTAKVIHEISKKFSIDLPIAEEVYKIIYNKKSPDLSIKTLLSRSLKEEFSWYSNE